MDAYSPIDEELASPAEVIAALGDIEGYMEDPELEMGLYVETIKVDLPVELDIHVNPDGSIVLGSAPPLYDVETSYTSILHQVKVTLVAEYGQENESEMEPGSLS